MGDASGQMGMPSIEQIRAAPKIPVSHFLALRAGYEKFKNDGPWPVDVNHYVVGTIEIENTIYVYFSPDRQNIKDVVVYGGGVMYGIDKRTNLINSTQKYK